MRTREFFPPDYDYRRRIKPAVTVDTQTYRY